jgi:single-stranded-DNA-specific exonuclease
MADPTLALKALLEGGPLIDDLDTLNTLRQEETQRALEHALTELIPDTHGELPPFLTIASHRYPHGILGLLAGKLTEKYGRPSMAVHIAGEICTASLRSPPGYNIVEALRRVEPMLVSFGGHAQAGGATFMLDHYIKIGEALERDAATNIPETLRTPSLTIDAELSLEAVTTEFCRELQSLEPFGQGNPEPMFLLRDVQLENRRRVGSDGRHLQATIGHCKAIGFGLGGLMDSANQSLDLACRVGMDTWNGIVRPQVVIQDVRLAVPRKMLVP